ncbi:MAG: glycosyltransferase family 4 protein [Nitriliruptorales bacterium]
MRIAQICPYDLSIPGGVQSHVHNLSERLRALGDEVLVVAPGTRPSSPSFRRRRASHPPAPREGGRDGLAIVGASVEVPFNGSLAPVVLSPLAVRRALTQLESFQPEVVHVHEPGVPVLSLGVALWGPTPMVGTFHSSSERELAYRTVSPLVRRAAGRLAARLAVSRAAVSYHARVLGLPAGSFREVPNGVDVARFSSASSLGDLTPDERPTLLFVGRLERRKGVEELLHAFVQLKSRRPDVRLLVVGDGPERDRCQALLPSRLQPAVKFLGRVPDEDLPRILASADVFVAPSRGGESFGIVLLEAMAAGLPVVATALPGYGSLVRDGVHGRLVPAKDTRALADALDTLLANPELRRAMGGQGRESASQYDWNVIAGLIRRVYADVVASTRETAPRP